LRKGARTGGDTPGERSDVAIKYEDRVRNDSKNKKVQNRAVFQKERGGAEDKQKEALVRRSRNPEMQSGDLRETLFVVKK